MIGTLGGSFRADFFSGLFGERRRKAATISVMVPHHFINRTQFTATFRRNHLRLILAGDIGEGRERHGVTEVELRGVFKAAQQPVIRETVEIHPLIP